MSELLDAALNYAKAGIPVFPVHGISAQGTCTCDKVDCDHPGKHPINKGGFKIATTEQAQIITWWQKYPEANIGIPTGRVSGWYVVDVDKRHNGIDNYKTLSMTHNLPSATLKAHTGGGGFHLIYAQPLNGQTVVSKSAIGRLPGVDFRGDGGYIVAPPSRHFEQVNYRWSKAHGFDQYADNPLVALPLVIANLVNSTSYPEAQKDKVPEGGRNDYLFKTACQFRRDGVANEQLLDAVLAENSNVCQPPLSRTEVKAIVDSALKRDIDPVPSSRSTQRSIFSPDDDESPKRIDFFKRVMSLTTNHEFWIDEHKRGYVTFEVVHKRINPGTLGNPRQVTSSHYENWPIYSKEYRAFLAKRYREQYQKPVSDHYLDSVIATLAGDVLFSDNTYKVHLRTAFCGNRIFIDLTDDYWNLVEITASGWRIFPDAPPVKFLRSTSTKPMFMPDPTGSLYDLRQIIRFRTDGDYLILAAWLMYSLVEGGPYPILALEGVPGSIKSSITKQLRQLIDPREPSILTATRNISDLLIHGHHSHLICLDNISSIKQDVSDILCGIATGTGHAARQLYTDMEEVYFTLCRPIILNSINPVAEFSDLADRTVRLVLPHFDDQNIFHQEIGHKRISSKESQANFENVAPKILGGLFTALQNALPLYEKITGLPSAIRMIDFAQWGIAAGDKLGGTHGQDFLDAFRINRRNTAYPLLDESVLNSAIYHFIVAKKEWTGSPTELYDELKKLVKPEHLYDNSFPKGANVLTRELNKAITTLKQFGIHYEHNGSNNHKSRKIFLRYNPRVDVDIQDQAAEAIWTYRLENTVTPITPPILPPPSPAPVNQGYQVVDNLADTIAKLNTWVGSDQLIGLDCETTGLNPRQDHLCLIQLSTGLETLIVDVRHISDLTPLQPILEKLHLVAHHAVFDMSFLQARGISINVECALIGHHVLQNESQSLKSLVKYYLDKEIDKAEQTSDWNGPLSQAQFDYAAQDASVLVPLFQLIKEKLHDREAWDAYEVVRNAQPFVVAMHLNGIQIDQSNYAAMVKSLQSQYSSLKQKWEQQVPNVNFNSQQQLSQWIAQEMEETGCAWPQTQNGSYSTKADDLQLHKSSLSESAANQIESIILPLKLLDKQLNTFGNTFLSHVDSTSGRLYPTFNLAGTVTGRMSCAKPNLQQIPRQKAYRKMFQAAVNHKLVIADYSQMELRIAALLADETTLLEAYQTGKDTHRLTAALLLGKQPQQVTAEERQLAKAVNFGLLYGQSAQGLKAYAASSYGVNMDMGDAINYRAAWFENYPGFARWHNTSYSLARNSMMVATPKGRKRYFTSTEYMDPKGLRRTVVYNTPVQGGAAEVLLAAMAEVTQAISLAGLTKYIKPIAVVHDEILLEAQVDYAGAAKELLETAMVQGMLSIFPSAATNDLVEAHIGDTWSDK